VCAGVSLRPCGGPSPGVRVCEPGCVNLGVRVCTVDIADEHVEETRHTLQVRGSHSGCVRGSHSGCVQGSESGCAGDWVRLCGCASVRACRRVGVQVCSA
jgi:hypothetical protein